MLLPFGMIEQVLRLVNNLLEGDPPEVRMEKGFVWWELWKPIVLPFLSESARTRLKEIEDSRVNP